ncbi:MAG: cation:proton antiporter [Terriglobales bacterium]
MALVVCGKQFSARESNLTLFLIFCLVLVIAVLVSEIAEKSVLSSSVLFLAAGFMVGRNLFGKVPDVPPDLLRRIAELALFSILFTDGIRTGGLRCVAEFWHLSGRALLIGMPLTIAGIALIGHGLLHTNWLQAFLVAAVLSPTDPVFVSAVFRFEGVPNSVKRVLNIESGLNDGLALPVVLLLLPHLGGKQGELRSAVFELLLGIVVGIVVPWLVIKLQESRFLNAVGLFEPLNAFAIGLLVLAVCYRSGANIFLGAFAAGITVASLSLQVAEAFERFGELVAELLKLLALLLFGAAMAPRFFVALSPWDYAFVVLATFAVRPLAILLAMAGTELTRREIWVVGWFGPKGFASVVYGILILQAGFGHLAHLVGLAVITSIIVYSSTDIFVGKWFKPKDAGENGASGIAET